MRQACIVAVAALGSLGAFSPCARAAGTSDERQARALRLIEEHVFSALTPGDQASVVAAGAFAPTRAQPEEITGPATDEQYHTVRGIVSREVFDGMRPAQRSLLQRMLFAQADGKPAPAVCFAPGTDPEIVKAFERARFPALAGRFQLGPRWVSTATNPGPLGQGDPVTITYSFVPDGTPIDSGAPSDLFARMNTIYPGGPAAWQALYDQVFDRWDELCAANYIREPNDDGLGLNNSSSFGVLGLRGDVRLSGSAIDGNSGILAYNYFPDQSDGVGGDMVVDTTDNFYEDTSGNSLRLRNVLAHEHGHGMGFPHVCPNIATKLMEPFVSTAFDGPQTDDILNAQRNYGDQLEANDSIPSATTLPGPAPTPTIVSPLSVDGTSDTDYYRFVAVPADSLLSVYVSPLGFQYAETFQNGGGSAGCVAPGTSIDPSRFRALTVRVRNAGGVILASATGAVGSAVTVLHATASAGDLFVEVVGDATNNVQGYSLNHVLTAGSPALGVYAPSPVPAQVSTSGATVVPVRVTTSGTLTGSPLLHYRFSPSAPYTTVAMTPGGAAGLWNASIPNAPCLASPQFYFSATAGSSTATLPAGAPSTVFGATVVRARITVFSDNFDTDKGWGYGQPGDTAVTGVWQRGDPAASSAQPDAAASGANCAATGLGTPGDAAGVHDVDTGFTRLVSPSFNLAAMRDSTIGYSRWYSNTGGAAPAADTFRVEISADNGGAWTPLETVGPAAPGTHGGWVVISLPLPIGMTPTSQMQLRFVAEDAGAGSLIEAAVDDVSISGSATADFNGNGQISPQDLFDYLKAFFLNSKEADFNKNGTGSPQDLFDFLKAYFAGC